MKSITIEKAAERCRELGTPVTVRGLRYACGKGYIPGAQKIGRDWLVPLDGLNYYLAHRPKRGRKSNKK